MELYDLALLATGEVQGILKYMYDYNRNVEYEKGYVARHVRNEVFRKAIAAIFRDKRTVGVRVYEKMGKTELPEEAELFDDSVIAHVKWEAFGGNGVVLLSHNGVSTVYREDATYPVAVFGENARYISEEALAHGAFIDVPAAKILQERGIDTGLIKSEIYTVPAASHTWQSFYHTIPTEVRLHRMQVDARAEIIDVVGPDSTPYSYRYENERH